MRFRSIRCASILLALFSWATQAVAIQQAFLVQNSGWMEPFYADPASPFKPLVTAVIQAASTDDDTVFTLAFSQSAGSNVSPLLLNQGRGGQGAAAALDKLGVASKGTALADTDFKEAVTGTITGPFKSAPGIVWIFTNNRNSPNNDAKTAERNRDFYRLLHLEPSITKTLVFPLRMPVQGKMYSAKGMMVYAMAYGTPAAEALDRIMAQGRLTKVLTRPAARLKPIDLDAVMIVPEAVTEASHLKVSLGKDQRTLVFDADSSGIVPRVTLSASLQNLFYPYSIRSANVEAALASGASRSMVQVSPATVSGLEPGVRAPVQISFDLPMAQVPSAWSPQALAAMGKQVILPMTLELSLGSQRLGLGDSFVSELRELFPGDPISESFTPPDGVKASRAAVPVVVRIQYPLMPLVAVLSSVLALIGGVVLAGLYSGRSKRFAIVVDDVRRNLMIKPFARVTVAAADGTVVGEIRRGLGAPAVVRVSDGHTLSIQKS